MVDTVFEDEGPVRSFSSFPTRPLTKSEWRVLEASDCLNVGPTAGYPDTGEITHLQLSVEDTFYHVGYNPDTTEWEQIAKLPLGDNDKEYVNAEFISVTDDDTGESVLMFEERPGESLIDAISRHVSEYIDHTYADQDRTPIVFLEDAAQLAKYSEM